jgi:hypothetical protein
MALQLETYTYLDISASHITDKDWDNLERDLRKQGPASVCVVARTDWGTSIIDGYWVSVGEYQDKADRKELLKSYSRYFLNIMLHAANNDCLMVRFDVDGARYSELPRFDNPGTHKETENTWAVGPDGETANDY